MEGILGLQPRDEAAILGVKTIKFESLRIFDENRVNFPVLDH